MTDVDPNSHPDQQTFSDLFQMLGTLTRYLQAPDHHVDEELLQQLVDACDDAARYYGNEHCDLPPRVADGPARPVRCVPGKSQAEPRRQHGAALMSRHSQPLQQRALAQAQGRSTCACTRSA